LRFLDRSPRSLGSLGFSPVQIARILSALSCRSGLVVCCGPTGSGKTTTLAAIAEILARDGRKVVSVEDPVEYRVPGVLHLESGGRDSEYLPAALRQDPDVLWIGEVRRREHIPPLQEATLSGHLVITTLHAEGVSGVIQRLANLGGSEALIRSHLILVCTQRLEGNPRYLQASLWNGTDGTDLV
jgi:general secretion pathway protein E